MILSISFYSYHFVRAILSIPFCPMIFCPYTIFSICIILSVPFCPLPFCPRTFGVLMKAFDLLYQPGSLETRPSDYVCSEPQCLFYIQMLANSSRAATPHSCELSCSQGNSA